MRYQVDFQHMPKGASRPLDDGEVIGISTDDQGFALIPNVGDYVHIDNDKDHSSFSGRVKTRLFNYIRTDSGIWCNVNIVVEDVDENVWSELIKE